MTTVDNDPRQEKAVNEINQVSLEVGKIESRLMEIGQLGVLKYLHRYEEVGVSAARCKGSSLEIERS